MKVTKIERTFEFKGKKLEDPNPKMTVDQVRSFYAAEIPELVNVTWKEEQDGNKLNVSFQAAVGKKG